MPRRSSSSVIVLVWGSPDRGLSTGRTDGGEGVDGVDGDCCVSSMLSFGIICVWGGRLEVEGGGSSSGIVFILESVHRKLELNNY